MRMVPVTAKGSMRLIVLASCLILVLAPGSSAQVNDRIYELIPDAEGMAEEAVEGIPDDTSVPLQELVYEVLDEYENQRVWFQEEVEGAILGTTYETVNSANSLGPVSMTFVPRSRPSDPPPVAPEPEDVVKKVVGPRPADEDPEPEREQLSAPGGLWGEQTAAQEAESLPVARPTGPEEEHQPILAPEPQQEPMRPMEQKAGPVIGLSSLETFQLIAAGLAAAVVAVPLFWGLAASAKFIVSLFSRTHGDAVLNDPTRRKIHQVIQAQPGLTIQQISETLGMNRSTLRHHINVLARERQIRTHSEGKTRHLYPAAHGGSEQVQAHACLVHEHRAGIARAILEQPGRSQKDVSRATNLPPSRVYLYTTHLAEAGLIEAVRRGRNRLYYPTGLLRTMGREIEGSVTV